MIPIHDGHFSKLSDPLLLAEAKDRLFLDELREKLEKLESQISGGLCYFTAEAKHAQLKDAMKTLKEIGEILCREN